MPVAPRPAHERVLARTIKTPGGCWEFQGATSERGYGIVQMGRGIGTEKAHRAVYAALVGPIPEGMTIDHLCANVLCVNPAHLEACTRSENTRRQWASGRANAGIRQKLKTHCLRGHPFDAANTYVYNGHRVCRACCRERARRYYASG